MYSATTFWLAIPAALLVGLCTGLLLSRFLGPLFGSSLHRNRESQREIDALRQEQQHYRDQVTGHFQRTAELVNELTSNYRAVHNHLAQGARDLCPETSSEMPSLLEAAPPRSASGLSGAAQMEPPRDYAPHGDAGIGPLHEAYGLEKNRRKDPEQPPRH